MGLLTTRLAATTGLCLTLVACDQLPDFDLRDRSGGFGTAQAVANLPARPRPDDRGVISYPNYQVVVARRDDTIRTIAQRLGLDTADLAAFNGVEPDVTLRAGELVALRSRVSEPSPATGAVGTGPIQPLDVTAIATTALDRAGPQQPTTQPVQAAPLPAAQRGAEPIRHRVARGETVFSISRLYGVPVRNIAEWNGLPPELDVREGQFLLIPQAGSVPPSGAAPAPAPVSEPGQGSTTPVPPSAAAPLPAATPSAPLPPAATPPAPNLGSAPEPVAAPPASAPDARFSYPVRGSIIRDYAPGTNEGIDIAVPAGTPVKAAGAGSVAAVTTDTAGVAIVVIKHPDNLLTVYTNLEDLAISKGDSVSAGATLGKVRAGDPSFVHFEVRRGLQSVDPTDFLP